MKFKICDYPYGTNYDSHRDLFETTELTIWDCDESQLESLGEGRRYRVTFQTMSLIYII